MDGDGIKPYKYAVRPSSLFALKLIVDAERIRRL